MNFELDKVMTISSIYGPFHLFHQILPRFDLQCVCILQDNKNSLVLSSLYAFSPSMRILVYLWDEKKCLENQFRGKADTIEAGV